MAECLMMTLDTMGIEPMRKKIISIVSLLCNVQNIEPLSYTNNWKRPSVCVPRKCAPYMSALAVHGLRVALWWEVGVAG